MTLELYCRKKIGSLKANRAVGSPLEREVSDLHRSRRSFREESPRKFMFLKSILFNDGIIAQIGPVRWKSYLRIAGLLPI
jgi:hypothetical protein